MAQYRSPFSKGMGSTPSYKEKGSKGGYDRHNNPVVGHRNEGFPRKFYAGGGALKPSHDVKVTSPLTPISGSRRK